MARTSRGSLPKVCTASVWNRTRRSRQSSPISTTGCTVPISLLACMTETSRVSAPVRIYGQILDLETLPRQRLERLQHGVMLDGRGEEMPAALPMQFRHAPNRRVVRLRAARRENDLFRGRVEGLRDDLPRLLHRLPRLHAEAVERGRIAVVCGEVG